MGTSSTRLEAQCTICPSQIQGNPATQGGWYSDNIRKAQEQTWLYWLAIPGTFGFEISCLDKGDTIKPPLPECQFELVQPVKKQYVSKLQAQSIYNKDPNSILVSAETYMNEYVINLKEN